MWTVRQRHGLLLILAGLIVAGAVIYWHNPVYVADPPPEQATPSALADRVDPNTADADTLAVVPGLGRKRAAEIVAYRGRLMEQRPGLPAFAVAKDLENVRGIGPATVENVQRYLVFPTTRP